VCLQNFKKLTPRRNVLAEKLVSEKEQKKAHLEQEEAKWSEGKNLFIYIANAKYNFKKCLLFVHLHILNKNTKFENLAYLQIPY
jgi:hypothetical protein